MYGPRITAVHDVCPCFISVSGTRSWGWENRQRVILFVDFRLDTISYFKVSGLHGGVVGMYAHFLPVSPFD